MLVKVFLNTLSNICKSRLGSLYAWSFSSSYWFKVLILSPRFKLVHLCQEYFLLTSFLQFSFHIFQISLFLLHCLVNQIVLFTQNLQSLRYLFLLYTSGFPLRDAVIWLQKSVPLHISNFLLVLFAHRHRVLLLEFLHDTGYVRLPRVFPHKVIGLWAR